jgi:hypothetical protein
MSKVHSANICNRPDIKALKYVKSKVHSANKFTRIFTQENSPPSNLDVYNQHNLHLLRSLCASLI